MSRSWIKEATIFTAFSIFTAVTPAPAAVTLQDQYEDFQAVTCSGKMICRMRFSAIPPGKTVVMTRASCRAIITPPAGTILTGVALDVVSSTNIILAQSQHLNPTLLGLAGSTRYYQVNNDTLHLYHSGQFPSIVFKTNKSSAFSITCQVGGTIK